MVNQLHQLTTPVPLVPPGTSGYPQGRDWFIIGYILLSLFRLGIWGGSTPRTYIGPIIFWGWASICQLFKLTRMHFVGKWMYHFCCQICWGMLGLPTLISLVSCRVRKIRICMYFYTDIGEETCLPPWPTTDDWVWGGSFTWPATLVPGRERIPLESSHPNMLQTSRAAFNTRRSEFWNALDDFRCLSHEFQKTGISCS